MQLEKRRKLDDLNTDFGDQLATKLTTIGNDVHFWKGQCETAIEDNTAQINGVLQG